MKLPPSVCFRVTRNCNAHCFFCLAPPGDSPHPDKNTLKHRIDWLHARHVTRLDFCGGEPTTHPDLAELIEYAYENGIKIRITTNGIQLPADVLQALQKTRARVKISLHGDRNLHNRMVGVPAFDSATETLHQLVSKGIQTSVQTMVMANGLEVVDWMADFCAKKNVKQLNIMAFIPRGKGKENSEFRLSMQQRSELKKKVKAKRHEFNSRLDIRWSDFNAGSIHVVETDGRIVCEKATESMDIKLGQIPEIKAD